MTDISAAPAAPAPGIPPGAETVSSDDTPPENINWEALSDSQPGEDDNSDPSTQGATPPAEPGAAPVTPPASATPPAPAAPTPPAAAPTQPGPATPAAAAPAAQPTTPPAQPAAPAAPSQTPEQAAAQEAALRKQMLDSLSAQYEKDLTEEDKTELLTNPEKAIPRLLAKTALDAIQVGQQLAYDRITKDLPAVMEHRSAANKAANDFLAANPDLSKPEFGNVVAESARMARSLMPRGTQAEVADKAATLARVALGLPLPGVPGAAPAGQPAAPAPATVARPFTPAGGGGSSPGRPAPAGTSKPEDLWADLATPD